MLPRVLVAVACVAVLAVVVQAQQNAPSKNSAFPYCQCNTTSGAYSLEPAVTSKTKGTYCFKVKVSPPAGCTSYCCSKADLRKIEFNVNPSCRVPGSSVLATINGVRTRVAATYDKAPNGPSTAAVLKLTQLGLNLTTADGAEVCVTLRTNAGGKGCTSLEDLCLPPAGAAPGTCAAALFDTSDDCCPTSEVSLKPCRTCVYFALTPTGPVSKPFNLTAAKCANMTATVARDIASMSAEVGATISDAFDQVSCEANLAKVCGTFASEPDGAKLKADIDDLAVTWLSLVTGDLTSTCPAELSNYTIAVVVGGDGADPTALPPSCLDTLKSTACKGITTTVMPFPKCACNNTQGVTPFAPDDTITQLPGRRNTTVLYCFTLKTVMPLAGPCANTSTVQKVEFWANEAVRGKVLGFSLRAAGAPRWTNISASWGGRGDETLKATPVNWNATQADGGVVCPEVDRAVTLDQLCLGPTPNTCWTNIFDSSRTCCPTYPTYFDA